MDALGPDYFLARAQHSWRQVKQRVASSAGPVLRTCGPSRCWPAPRMPLVPPQETSTSRNPAERERGYLLL
jgi:hypothetical protein